jgi:hypothetical protein
MRISNMSGKLKINLLHFKIVVSLFESKVLVFSPLLKLLLSHVFALNTIL